MAILKPEEIDCAVVDGRMRLRIAGRTHYLDLDTARGLGLRLGNLALDHINLRPGDLPTVQDILLTFPSESAPVIRLITSDGDFAMFLPERHLQALAAASAAALEHGNPRGRA